MDRSASPGAPLVAEPLIEPAFLQFIEREFQDILVAHPSPARLISELHRALFIERKSVAIVRNEFSQRRRAARVIAVSSGKGGVGKTTVSINLAVALARRGQLVLLLDGDLGMANVHIFAGVSPRGTLLDVIEGRATMAQVLTAGPAGVQILCGASGVAGLANLDARVIQRLGRELLHLGEEFDVILIDTGAGISAQVMEFLSLAHEIIVVATPNLAATLDAYGVIKLAREAGLPGRISIVVNQFDEEAEVRATFARLTGCAQRFLQFEPASLGSLRRDPSVEAANQNRVPLVLAQPASENARQFTAMAADLVGENSGTIFPRPATHAA
jgi:flagellar biosynthesis protein FlhG